MKENILIVEDEFIVANDLRLILKKAGHSVCGIASSVQEAKTLIEQHQSTWVLLDIFLKDGSKGTELASYLTERRIGFVYTSANTNQRVLEAVKSTQPYGFLHKPFRERDLLMMLDIAFERHRQNIEFEHLRAEMLKKHICDIIGADLTKEEKLLQIPGTFQMHIPFDYLKLNLLKYNELGVHEVSFMREDVEQYLTYRNGELAESMNLLKKDLQVFKPKLPDLKKGVMYNGMEFRKQMFDEPWERISCTHFDFKSKMSFPLMLENGVPAALTFYSKKVIGYSALHMNLLRESEDVIKKLIEQATQKVTIQLGDNRSTISDKIYSPGHVGGIVGTSPELVKVLDSISLVSQSEISVLITGESGTGKEQVAQAIHRLSPRKNKPLVTVNCAALPHDLIESELFGHVKGAYTGAIEKRMGKFELANGGTLFLDEIGEMPLDAQVKLLRVLQEKEIDHLGGKQSVKIDVRVIAATNRQLEKEVAEGRFRLDLYYRLNVYPIDMPPLRNRKQDIPLLAAHFLNVFAKDTGRKISGFSQVALDQLKTYDWPGNIRELGHLIQRTMIMTTGGQINNVVLPEMKKESKIVQNETELKTLEQMEKAHILGVLRRCNGKICGLGGAAEILDLPPSTLNSKIKKLGIKREYNM